MFAKIKRFLAIIGICIITAILPMVAISDTSAIQYNAEEYGYNSNIVLAATDSSNTTTDDTESETTAIDTSSIAFYEKNLINTNLYIGQAFRRDISVEFASPIEGSKLSLYYKIDNQDTTISGQNAGTTLSGKNLWFFQIDLENTSAYIAGTFIIYVRYAVDTDTSIILRDDMTSLTINIMEQSKTVWDWVMSILNSAVGTTLSITAAVTIVFRAVLKIYNLGKSDKKNLITREDMKEFENSTRKDVQSYARQITNTVSDSVMRIIEKELKPLDDVKEMSTEMKIAQLKVENDMKMMSEKYDEIKQIGDTVRSLSTKVNRIEYGQDTTVGRRSETK